MTTREVSPIDGPAIAQALGRQWRYDNLDPDGQPFHYGQFHLINLDADLSIWTWGPSSNHSPRGSLAFHIGPHSAELRSAASRVYWPSDTRPGSSINCSTSKTPEKIAADITRRLLPNGIALRDRAREEESRRTDRAGQIAAWASLIAAADPRFCIRKPNGNSDAETPMMYGAGAPYDLRLGYSEIEFRSLRLAPELAAELVAWLKLRAPEAGQ